MSLIYLLVSLPTGTPWQFRLPPRPDAIATILLCTSLVAHPATSLAVDALTTGRSRCNVDSTASRTIVTCLGGPSTPSPEGSLRVNPVSSNENGVSTSSVKNPSHFSAPWSYKTATDSASTAWSSLRLAVTNLPGVIVELEVTSGSGPSYLHASVPTQFPPGLDSRDDLEFVLRPEDGIVLYRSSSRASLFVYPVTQPVGDKDSNLKRLEGIRESLNFGKLEY